MNFIPEIIINMETVNYRKRFESFFILFLIILSSCNKINDSKIPKKVPTKILGSNWQIITDLNIIPRQQYDDGNNPIMLFTIENSSDYPILFPPDFGVQLFSYISSEDTWLEIDNNVSYLGNEELLTPKKTRDINYSTSLTVSPDFENNNQIKDDIWVCITGEVINNENSSTFSGGNCIDFSFRDGD